MLRVQVEQQARKHRHTLLQQHHAQAVRQGQAQQQPGRRFQGRLLARPLRHEVAQRPHTLHRALLGHRVIQCGLQCLRGHPDSIDLKGLGQPRVAGLGLPHGLQGHLGQQVLELHLDEATAVAAHEGGHLNHHMGFFNQVGHHPHRLISRRWHGLGLPGGIQPQRLQGLHQQHASSRCGRGRQGKWPTQLHALILEMVS